MNGFAAVGDGGTFVLLAIVTTVVAALTIGVAFLSKPGRATLYWTICYTLVMLASYGLLLAEASGNAPLRAVSLGIVLSGPPFLWSGFRILWGRRAHLWIPLTIAVAGSALLLTMGAGRFDLAYRLLLFLSASFAALFLIEWMLRRGPRREPLVLPLAVLSAVLFTVAVIGVVGAFLPGSDAAGFDLLRRATRVTLVLHIICAAIAEIAVTLRDSPLVRVSAAVGTRRWAQFQRVARARLGAAERGAEPVSVVCIRLDDAEDLRHISGVARIAALFERFASVVREAVPGDTEIGSPRLGTAVVLIHRADSTVREVLRAILDEVTGLGKDLQLPISPTASAGWASASTRGYDFDTLLAAATRAEREAHDAGGDLWNRVGGTDEALRRDDPLGVAR